MPIKNGHRPPRRREVKISCPTKQKSSSLYLPCLPHLPCPSLRNPPRMILRHVPRVLLITSTRVMHPTRAREFVRAPGQGVLSGPLSPCPLSLFSSSAT